MPSFDLWLSLLRDPVATARRCDDEAELRPLVLLSIVSVLVGTLAFGAVLGSFRGGLQIACSAIKVPLAFMLTLVVCVPAFHATARVLGLSRSLRTIVAITMCAAARASLVLLALTPLLWLFFDRSGDYHASTLAAVVLYAIAGSAALRVLVQGMGDGIGARLATLVCIGLFFGIGAQSAWIARPFLGRPAQVELPFVRSPEGGFVRAVLTSSRSAAGVYDDADADGYRDECHGEDCL